MKTHKAVAVVGFDEQKENRGNNRAVSQCASYRLREGAHLALHSLLGEHVTATAGTKRRSVGHRRRTFRARNGHEVRVSRRRARYQTAVRKSNPGLRRLLRLPFQSTRPRLRSAKSYIILRLTPWTSISSLHFWKLPGNAVFLAQGRKSSARNPRSAHRSANWNKNTAIDCWTAPAKPSS